MGNVSIGMMKHSPQTQEVRVLASLSNSDVGAKIGELFRPLHCTYTLKPGLEKGFGIPF